MTTAQRIIKYCAIAFALVLIVGIVGGIVSSVSFFSSFFGGEDNIGEMKSTYITGKLESLDIEIGGAAFEIKEGSEFKIESNQKNLETENNGGVLKIKETGKIFGFRSNKAKVILTVPKGFTFDKIDFSAGAGEIKIEALTAKKLSLELGAGKADIGTLTAHDKAKISGGAGKLTIGGGELNDFDFEMGVGEANIESRLKGDCSIDHGVGKLKLSLIGTLDDYRIYLDKGIGSATINGKNMNDNETYGSGDTRIEIDSGVGELNIVFK